MLLAARAMALSPIALATADGCQSGYTPWGGGGFCDGPTQPNGSYYHCATTYVFGFGGTQCGWVCPPPPDNLSRRLHPRRKVG